MFSQIAQGSVSIEKIRIHGVWALTRRGESMFACIGHTDGDFAHSINGVAPFYGLAPYCRLADCSREG